VKWFFLGLFFHVFAIAFLYFKGPVGGGSMVQSGQQVVETSARQNPPVFQPSQAQNGEVDLNSLRAAVRQQPNASSATSTDASESNGVLEPERQAFLDSLASTLSTINFGPVSAEIAQELSHVWMQLGKTLVFSDLAGGLSENNEFYQCHEEDSSSAVWFYPVSPNGANTSALVELAVPIKRFASESVALQSWVHSQSGNGFAKAVLQKIDSENESILIAYGQCSPNLVTADSLGELCEEVRGVAGHLRETIPSRFGGIWI
jgi:hypothetical protein